MSVELSIIIPTYNEEENIKPLLAKLEECLNGLSWEVLFVDDDSHDGTSEMIRRIAQQKDYVRCLQRIGRKGLASACVEGMLFSSATFLAVMDADMQHDEHLLKQMIEILKKEDIDIVIGSRYIDGGSISNWSKRRALISRIATSISSTVMRVNIKDPMSGFFMLKRDFFDQVSHDLSAKGYKILLDICMTSSKPVRFKELPYVFRPRHAGSSKLNIFVGWEYIALLMDKLFGSIVPVRFLLFVMIGFGGAVMHLLTLYLSLNFISSSFVLAQTIATVLAMTANFVFNNMLTFYDMRLKHWRFIRGLIIFYMACSIGAFINIQVSFFLYNLGTFWWLAGLIGAALGSIWNYAITTTYTWNYSNKK